MRKRITAFFAGQGVICHSMERKNTGVCDTPVFFTDFLIIITKSIAFLCRMLYHIMITNASAFGKHSYFQEKVYCRNYSNVVEIFWNVC